MSRQNRKIYMRVIMMQRHRIDNLSKDLHAAASRQQETPSFRRTELNSNPQTRPQIFRSEMDYISRCILDYPNIETGGQLFGYWTVDGIPVVMYAIGPGPRANHQSTFFNQDVNYLLEVGNALRSRYGLQHIGEWHSHHRLGLASPSGHDSHTMVSTIREKNLGRFLLCIGNCNDRGSSLNPFMCDTACCVASSWNIIEGESPVRRVADSEMAPLLIHPRTRCANYSDPSMGAAAAPATPEYPEGYWLEKKSNGAVLNRMLEYMRSRNYQEAKTTVKLDRSGLVHLVSTSVATNGMQVVQDILFPQNFPNEAPQYKLLIGSEVEEKTGKWKYKGDIFNAFVKYYNYIND